MLPLRRLLPTDPRCWQLLAKSPTVPTRICKTPEHTTHARGLVGANKVLNVVLPCCLTTDPAIGRAVGRAMVSIYLPLPAYQRQWASQGFEESDWTNGGSDRLVDTYVAWGSIESIRNRMREHIDAGANSIIMAAGGYSHRELVGIT